MSFKSGLVKLLQGSKHCSRSIQQVRTLQTHKKLSQLQQQQQQQQLSPSVLESQSKLSELPNFNPGLVIFDKDGTLVCFHTMWNSWCEQLASRMNNETESEVTEELYDMLGYDSKSKKVRMGMLAEKTHPYIKTKVVKMLMTQCKFSQWEAEEVMNKTWKDTPENLQIKMTGNLTSLFKQLREKNIKIAICTSDSREGTQEFLTKLSLDSLVDLVLCGDDKDSISKPNPHNALFICDKLGVSPNKTIMVGDTPADTIMGQQASLGLTVGVLSGVGDSTDLCDADLIVPDVADVVNLVCPDTSSSDNTRDARASKIQLTSRGLAKITSTRS